MAYKQTLSLDILHEIIQYYFADTPSRHTSSLADDATRLKLVCKDWNRIVSKILQNPTKTVPPISKLPVELHHKIFSYVLAHNPNDQWVADRECTELMLVCRSWRDIIMDWSARWCNVQLKNPNAVAHALNRTRATERSGGLPVPLDITGNLYRGVAGYMRMVRHIRKHMDHIRRVDIKVSRKALRQWVVANPVNPDFPAPILEELQLKKYLPVTEAEGPHGA
ncbi:hypothetical protein GLOTRDRAFT_131698 [Gloeophyllum trabeum ATCC 11539]|uniref:F-box domain-containing protein n=1 Tax=Gloeophyllum trabeum (strain ATCC 11539 / FP-39264 / Madison 617) TaxID=670483 RepID=S7PYQ5_GLOTA|nr:uncharacterized protein GLOTRDRAFT_131698 [Gloeophyllum trabeum ATCC 11539]EPQ52457.1 hypothetical protein GLOTRDRAFT_131698 [Gloeophyllum trabeum ATCC 11539]